MLCCTSGVVGKNDDLRIEYVVLKAGNLPIMPQ